MKLIQSLNVNYGISPLGTNQNGITDSPIATMTCSTTLAYQTGASRLQGICPYDLVFGCLVSTWMT